MHAVEEKEEENKDDHEKLLRALTEVIGRYCSSVNRSNSLPVENTNSVRERVRKSASMSSAKSTRTRALKEFQKLEEWNRLEEFEEENQRKLLELERK